MENTITYYYSKISFLWEINSPSRQCNEINFVEQILLSTSILIYTEELLKYFLSIVITENEEINVVQDITNSIVNGRRSRILTVVSYFKWNHQLNMSVII